MKNAEENKRTEGNSRKSWVSPSSRGKGSHTYWKHPLLPEEPLTIPGKDGDDAPLYLEKKHSAGAEKAGRTRK
ncbi:type II toxin-antitoxin system HicA family toxin [Aphanizomenon flos-aquae]|uniref:type II toxin-antitoxin system HicA family toxin n=1 Tax=Aphanizomenon flos-aquae TaxID=1176 RepID=UPI000A5D8060